MLGSVHCILIVTVLHCHLGQVKAYSECCHFQYLRIGVGFGAWTQWLPEYSVVLSRSDIWLSSNSNNFIFNFVFIFN